MEQSHSIPRGPVNALLNFFSPPTTDTAPYAWDENHQKGVALPTNFGTESHEVTIHDLRGREKYFNLNDHSFATLSGVQSEVKEFTDAESIKQEYYPEVKKLILDNVPGATRVFIFDHTVRRAGNSTNREPFTRTHIDQTPVSARMRVERHMPDEAEELLRGRYRIINVWRPLNGPVVAHPLAFADSSTFAEEDLVSVEHRFPDRVGYTTAIRYDQKQRWYYLSGARNDERILLQCSDSTRANGGVPHSAFVDPRTPDIAPRRESIEVRALVFG